MAERFPRGFGALQAVRSQLRPPEKSQLERRSFDDESRQHRGPVSCQRGANSRQELMAVPYIVNFSMVDGDGDGKITADEFKAGCAKGMVKSTMP